MISTPVVRRTFQIVSMYGNKGWEEESLEKAIEYSNFDVVVEVVERVYTNGVLTAMSSTHCE